MKKKMTLYDGMVNAVAIKKYGYTCRDCSHSPYYDSWLDQWCCRGGSTPGPDHVACEWCFSPNKNSPKYTDPKEWKKLLKKPRNAKKLNTSE